MCQIRCQGSGGQSFGAFLPQGITIRVHGDANDYFGKGLSGGKLSITPDERASYRASDNIIIGNVALYGATSGEAYINGIAGERFAVRNSGATAVVEGCGDHALEYMTGGCVLILGRTGKNVAAGMSGGIAYLLDEDHDLYLRLNKAMVTMEVVSEEKDLDRIREMLEKYVRETKSEHGAQILEHFDVYAGQFKKIIPNDYRRMMQCIHHYQQHGFSPEEAKLRAFEQMKGGK